MHNENNPTLIKANFIKTANFLKNSRDIFLKIDSRFKIRGNKISFMTSQQRSAYIALLFISAMVALTYTQQPESEQSDAVIVGIVISFIFIIGLFSQAARKQSEARGGKSLAV